jgi:hypothetical protein
MNAKVMEDWFIKVVVPWATDLLGRKAIFLDNCSAHFSEAVIKECERLNISFIPLPPNATWLTQPCDVALFKSLKTAWRFSVGQFNEVRVAQGFKPYETLPRPFFCEVLDMTIDRMRSNSSRDSDGLSQLIFKAFHATGIFPLNASVVVKKLPVLASSSSSARDMALEDVRSVVSSSSSERMMGAFVDAANRPLFARRGRGGRPLGPAGVPLTMASHKYVFFILTRNFIQYDVSF